MTLIAHNIDLAISIPYE